MAFNFRGADRTVSSGVRLVKCGECGRCAEPLEMGGQGKREILVVFDQPTASQYESKSWFMADRAVLKELNSLGFELEQDLWVTAVLPCPGSKVNHYEFCSCKLQETIKKLKPKLIITVGPAASGAVMRLYNSSHFEANFTTAQYYGRCIPLTENGWSSWLAPVQSDGEIHSYHNQQMQAVSKGWLNKHLAYATDIARNRPVKVDLPKVDLLFDTQSIVEAIDAGMSAKYVAFDYETNCIQPEQEKARILTASMAIGDSEGVQRTVAFPMSSEVVKEKWCDFLQSDVLKLGANIKFEHRWSSVWLKTPVVNWKWDICIGARIMDCFTGNSGLKYQTFVNFGMVGYDDAVDLYMHDNQGGYNALDQAPVTDLLTYNAYDSYYTYLSAKLQHLLLNVKF